MNRKRAAVVFTSLAIVLFLGGGPLAQEEKPEPVSGKGKSLVYPKVVLDKNYPSEITGIAMASRTGAVVVSTNEEVDYYLDKNSPAWSVGKKEGWKLIQDLGVSADGTKVLFQTDVKPKKSTEMKELTVRLLDGQGNELWRKPNPGRYQNATLSPLGNYIIMGEHMHPGLYLYDQNLIQLWRKEINLWYVSFDPGERYVFDGQGGKLYTIEGKETWDFGRNTRILSVSDDAEYVLTSSYAKAGQVQSIWLNARIALRKVELFGTGGCIGPDGTMMAYVDGDGKLLVYRTRELLEQKPGEFKPLFQDKFVKPWVMRIARDNRSLFVMGVENELSSVIMLIDLENMKVAWKKPVGPEVRFAQLTEDNRLLAVKDSPNSFRKFECY